MAKKSTLEAWAEFIPALVAISVVRFLPWSGVRTLGRGAGLLVYLLLGRYRQIAYKNMDIAFADCLSDQEKKQIVLGAFNSFGQTIFEAVRAAYFSPEDILELTESTGEFERLLRSDDGVLICTAHQGNFFWPGLYAVSLGYTLTVVIEPLENTLLHRKYLRLMERFKLNIVTRERAAMVLPDILAQGGKVMMVVDQEAQRGGVFVPFFGVDAATQRGSSAIARLSGSRLAFVSHRREGKMNVVSATEPFQIHCDDTPGARIIDKENMRIINGHIERCVRECPEEYLWLHPRWKTRPPGEELLYD